MNVKSTKNSDNFYEQIWESGELKEAAKRYSTAADLAKHFGKTSDGLVRGLYRLREKGYKVPSIRSMLDEATDEVADGAKPTATAHNTESASQEDLSPVEEHRLKRKVKDLEEHAKQLMNELLNTQDALGVMKEAAQHKVPPLEPREKTSGLREACSLVLISDTHLDEVVEKEAVNGLNEYNPDIARRRMERLFTGARWLTNYSRQAHAVRDMVVWLGGDTVSGIIHEDLRETNAMGLPESIAFAQQILSDGLNYLLKDEKLESLRVVCSVGNHGRLTKEVRVNTRISTNIETLLYLNLAREFANDPRVSFDLPQGELTYFQVYDRVVRVTHGDALKYGGALGGLTNPINRAISRWDMSIAADLTLMGHWHQYMDCGKFIVNGSVVGLGPFSVRIQAPYERPQQAWALLDAKRWRSLSAPIWCDDDE